METRNKWKKNDPTDPSDQTNPAITLDLTDHDPSDPKVRNKYFFSFQISWIIRINDPSVQTNRHLIFSCRFPASYKLSFRSALSR